MFIQETLNQPTVLVVLLLMGVFSPCANFSSRRISQGGFQTRPYESDSYYAFFAYFAVNIPNPIFILLCDLCTTIVENLRRLRKLCNHAIATPPPQGVS